MKLCLGAFLKLVMLCKADGWSGEKLFEKLISSLPGSHKIPLEPHRITGYMQCKDDIAKKYRKTIKAELLSPGASQVKSNVWEDIHAVLDEDRLGLFLIGLRKLVQEDQEITPTTPLNTGDDATFGQIENALLGTTRLENGMSSMGAYVTSIFLYVILNTRNRSGTKAEVEQLTIAYLEELKKEEGKEPPNLQELEAAISMLSNELDRLAADAGRDRLYLQQVREEKQRIEAAISHFSNEIEKLAHEAKSERTSLQLMREEKEKIEKSISRFERELHDLKKDAKKEREDLKQADAAGRAFRVLPVLNRLSQSVIHNRRLGRDTPVLITRACLYALISGEITAGRSDQLRSILLKGDFTQEDLKRLKEYCELQAEDSQNVDRHEWRELGKCLKGQQTMRYLNITIGDNACAAADESAATECLYRALSAILDSSVAGHMPLVEQMCFTFSKFLNALSSNGYFQSRSELDQNVLELRREQLLSCIRLMQDERCRYASSDQIFALIERDEQGNCLVDGLETEIVHEIVSRYYEVLDTSKVQNTIGVQYLEWCTRNDTIFPKRLITELICFDLPLWDYYAQINFHTLALALYAGILSKFKDVSLDVNGTEPIRSIEGDSELIRRVRQMMFLFSNARSASSFKLRGLFIVSNIRLPGYFECVAQMTVYMLNHPALFRDGGNAHCFNHFVLYMCQKATNRTWLYQSEAFRHFDRWDSVITTDGHLLQKVKNLHRDLYNGQQKSDSPPHGPVIPSPRSLEERIRAFREMEAVSVQIRKEALVRLMEQILRERSFFDKDDCNRAAAFAREWLDSDDPKLVGLAFDIVGGYEDTSAIRLEKLRALGENTTNRRTLGIYLLEGYLSRETADLILEEACRPTATHWQRLLSEHLLGKLNNRQYLRNPKRFPKVAYLRSRMCEKFTQLSLELQIDLIYAVRDEPALLDTLDFSVLCFEETPDELQPTRYALWRFYHELEKGKQIRLGTLDMEYITLYLVDDSFCALLTSNREIRNAVGENWNNAVYHIARNTKSRPALSASLCAFAAYKLLGWMQNRAKENLQEIRDIDTQMTQLSRAAFSHPCLYNLMTDMMNRMHALMLSSGQGKLFPELTSYIIDNAAAEQRTWFDTGIKSAQNDRLEKMVVDAADIWVLKDQSTAQESEEEIADPELTDYIRRGNDHKPFEPSEPVVVVEENGALFAIERRKTVRYIQENFKSGKISLCVYKLIFGEVIG